MSKGRHIVSTSNNKTVGQMNTKEGKKIGKQHEGSSGQTDERPAGPYHTPIPEWTTDAWLPDNNENSKILWSVFRPKHYLSTSWNT